MSSLVAAWTLYLSTVYVIYKIATKLPEFLNPRLFRSVADGIQNYEVAKHLGSINASIKLFVDKAFQFRPVTAGIFLPSLTRAAVFSALLFLFFSLPALYLIKHRGPLGEMQNLSVIGDVFLAFCMPAFVADYLSFVKSRYLIERAYNANKLSKILLTIALDILASVIIVFIVLQLFRLVMTAATSAESDWVGLMMVDVIADELLFYLTISATAVTFCSVIVSIIHILYFKLHEVDAFRSRLFQVLNFEDKPHIALAVIVIAGFTLVFWPVAIPIALAI
jgi:hypothetical protein